MVGRGTAAKESLTYLARSQADGGNPALRKVFLRQVVAETTDSSMVQRATIQQALDTAGAIPPQTFNTLLASVDDATAEAALTRMATSSDPTVKSAFKEITGEMAVRNATALRAYYNASDETVQRALREAIDDPDTFFRLRPSGGTSVAPSDATRVVINIGDDAFTTRASSRAAVGEVAGTTPETQRTWLRSVLTSKNIITVAGVGGAAYIAINLVAKLTNQSWNDAAGDVFNFLQPNDPTDNPDNLGDPTNPNSWGLSTFGTALFACLALGGLALVLRFISLIRPRSA